jgi:hypothetical protein
VVGGLIRIKNLFLQAFILFLAPWFGFDRHFYLQIAAEENGNNIIETFWARGGCYRICRDFPAPNVFAAMSLILVKNRISQVLPKRRARGLRFFTGGSPHG